MSGHRARAPACSTRRGTLLATARHPITIWHEAGDIVEQSSADIWPPASPRSARRMARGGAAAGRRRRHRLRRDLLAGGARRRPRNPLTRQPIRRRPTQCHRLDGPSRGAEARADQRDADEVLRYVGGSISPEMEIAEAALAEAASAGDLSPPPGIFSISPTS